MILAMCDEVYKLRIFALCSFRLVLLLPLSDQNMLPAPAPFPQWPSVYVPVVLETKFDTHNRK